MNKKKNPLTLTRRIVRYTSRFLGIVFLFLTITSFYGVFKRNYQTTDPLSLAENNMAVFVWEQLEKNKSIENQLGLNFFETTKDYKKLVEPLNKLKANSAIIIDASTGSILFEKNSDKVIPPASMTKLVGMYTTFKAIENGEISLDDIVDLPKESWATNIPPGSSLMFLSEGHIVSVEELIYGMAVPSGNDAAIALAHHVSGNVNSFIKQMNSEVQKLNLKQTFFVEPSGLSELNKTTAKEFAVFSREYCNRFPETLKQFNSKLSLDYPMPWNLPPGRNESPVIQKSTYYPLLTQLEGCDGLKTGFIYESGFNLALTAKRGNTRFISVTMDGPWNNFVEGSRFRNEDGSLLMEWAFTNFKTITLSTVYPFPVTVWGSPGNAVWLLPAHDAVFTSEFPDIKESMYTLKILLPEIIQAPILAGEVLGEIGYFYNNKKYHSIPLIADRNLLESKKIFKALDLLAAKLSGVFTK